MKRCLGLFLLAVFTFNTFAAPLIFKTVKKIDFIDFVDLAVVDVSKYKQIRVAVKVEKPESESQRVNIYSVEDDKEVFLFGKAEKDLDFSTVLDSPPTKIKLKGRGNGIYHIYIYAIQ